MQNIIFQSTRNKAAVSFEFHNKILETLRYSLYNKLPRDIDILQKYCRIDLTMSILSLLRPERVDISYKNNCLFILYKNIVKDI